MGKGSWAGASENTGYFLDCDVSGFHGRAQPDQEFACGNSGRKCGQKHFAARCHSLRFRPAKGRRQKITSRNLLFMALGGVSAATVFSLFMGDIKINGDPASIPWFHYVAAVLHGSVLAPLYEEKLCRGLQLKGMQAIAGSVVAILLTSAFFGFVHKGNEIATSIHAVILACMALYFRIGVIERAVAHGAYNFALYSHVSFLLLPV